ncbi:hypothetical protein KR084_009908 [Drosophila pseudotakahashii]|nr:hypothetical protein KR084_009908 [Drosophila pseudotakahashii]
MFKFSHYILYLIILLNFYGTSVDSSQDSSESCILKNAPQQCGAFCLSALGSLYEYMAKFNLSLSITQYKLDRIEGDLRHIKMDRVEKSAMDFNERLKKMEDQQSALENKLQDVQITLGNEFAAVRKILSSIVKTMPSVFERIGSKYYYIEERKEQTRNAAMLTCRRIGGQLASIKNQEELTELSAQLEANSYYWIDLFEPRKRGEFTSLSSNKTDPFLKWNENEPLYEDKSLHCVLLISGLMSVSPCDKQSKRYICQADEEI